MRRSPVGLLVDDQGGDYESLYDLTIDRTLSARRYSGTELGTGRWQSPVNLSLLSAKGGGDGNWAGHGNGPDGRRADLVREKPAGAGSSVLDSQRQGWIQKPVDGFHAFLARKPTAELQFRVIGRIGAVFELSVGACRIRDDGIKENLVAPGILACLFSGTRSSAVGPPRKLKLAPRKYPARAAVIPIAAGIRLHA